MEWWQVALAALGVGGSYKLPAVWRGLRAFVEFGDAIPKIATYPEELARLGVKLDAIHAEVIAYATTDEAAYQQLSQELREHMDIEDSAALTMEKAWVGLLAAQHEMRADVVGLRGDVVSLRQIVMNVTELGAGDRWRLTQDPGETGSGLG